VPITESKIRLSALVHEAETEDDSTPPAAGSA
jgi:hypothetical protein